VFPVYYAGLPPIVRRFAEALVAVRDPYVFAVPTYGGATGDSIKELRAALEPGNTHLAAAFGVHMPQNGFRKPWENHLKIHAAWHTRGLPRIVKAVLARRGGTDLKNVIGNALLSPLSGWLRSKTRTHLAEISGLPEDASLDELFARSDASFSVTSECTACGICSRVCPVGNIEMTENGPQWLHGCENCHACYHWCSEQAIQSEIVPQGYYYHSPEVSLADMLAVSGSHG
jgi:ferredoxin